MPIVKMPDGQLVDMPDNPSEDQLRELESIMSAASAATAAPAATAEPSPWQKAGRIAGLGARAVAKSALAVPSLITDSITGTANALGTLMRLPGPKLQPTAPMIDRFLSSTGLPEPETGTERVASAIVEGGAGAGGMAKLLKSPQIFIPTAAGAGGGGAAELAKEQGANPVVQVLLGLSGGAAAGTGAGVLQKGGELAANVVRSLHPAGRDLIKGRLMNELAGPRAPTVISELDKNQTFVPGVQNTAATAARDAGSTEFAALEKLLSQRAPSEYRDLERANQAEMQLHAFHAKGTRQKKQAAANIADEELRQREVADMQRRGMLMAREKVGAAMTPALPPPMLERSIMVMRAVLQRVQGGPAKQTIQELAHEMRNPARIADLMRNATPQERLELTPALQAIAGGAAAGTGLDLVN